MGNRMKEKKPETEPTRHPGSSGGHSGTNQRRMLFSLISWISACVMVALHLPRRPRPQTLGRSSSHLMGENEGIALWMMYVTVGETDRRIDGVAEEED